MAKSNELRQRKKGEKKSKNKAKADNELPPPEHDFSSDDNKPEPSLSAVFFQHPLIRVGRFIVLPYLLFQVFNYVALHKPQWVSQATGGWITIRPSVPTLGERQVLILGASVSDNKQVASTLSSTLQLELAHETFDSLSYYCRDGTASWYQFMRFLSFAPATKNSTEVAQHKLEAWKEICLDRNSSLVTQFFHPQKYAPSPVCSSRELWSNCWSKECILTLQASWDCQNSDVAQPERHCKPPFRKVLHQTRHPLTTIENLNKTYCELESIRGSFLNIVAGFFPHRDWHDMTCLEAVAYYTLDFESTLLRARKEGGVVDGMFPMESTSPCEVASMAGFTDPTHALYGAHLDRLTTWCHADDGGESLDKKTLQKAEKARSKHAFVPRVPKSLQKKSMTWTELEMELSATNKDGLIDSLKTLSKELGYAEGGNANDEAEFA